MKTLNFLFATHNHQPIGNFESVFEETYQKSYKPFIDVLERHPRVKITQHWTGPLLEWLSARHPELIERMRGMVQCGQLELLTGAYYEAILSIIPEADRQGQIKKLTAMVKKLFGYTPRGMWVAERVWEQQLVKCIAEAGVEFVMVDDTHFRQAGLSDEELLGYHVTEELGRTLNVFPIDKTLRYTIPFRTLSESFDYFRRVASEDGKHIVVHADDGEKFGGWPKTYHTVYEEGWLDGFCRMIEQEQAWVRTVHAGTAVDLFQPMGRVYLPTASYGEMMKWALGNSAFLRLEEFEKELKKRGLFERNAMFVRGGYWRNFLAKYPESNHMHKKMLRIASRLHTGEMKRLVPDTVREALWAGQCNDPYWHGVFGGLYLPNLRMPVYRSLLAAEIGIDAAAKRPGPIIEEVDFDCDGHTEIVVESPRFDMCFTPSFGASLVELSVKPDAVNLLDILSRREEGYHKRLLDGVEGSRDDDQPLEVKEAGLENHLFFDWYRHGSLIDHFFGDSTTLYGMMTCRYQELGDFVNQPYTVNQSVAGDAVEMVFERHGALWNSGTPHHLTVRKVVRYVSGEDTYTADYTLSNDEQTSVDLWFGIELCVGSMAGDAHDRFYEIEGRILQDRRLRSTGEEPNVHVVRLVDRWLQLQTIFSVDVPATMWRFPIETVSISEGGFERIYQASVVVPHWRVRLTEADSQGSTFRVRIGQTVTTI